MIQLISQIILLIGTLISGIIDAKTGYIYDYITYPMIIIGFLISLISFNYFNLISGAIIFVILFLMYYFGKIGGGDVKLFTSIALLNPYNNIEFLMIVFFVSALTSLLFYSIYYSIKYFRQGINFKREKNNVYNSILIGVFLFLYLIILIQFNTINYLTIYFIFIPMFFGLIFVALQKGIKIEFFEQKIKIKDLEEDEILSENNNKKIKKIIGLKVIGEKEKKELLKNKIKEIYVLRNLPKFGPFIFIGISVGIYFPNLINLIF